MILLFKPFDLKHRLEVIVLISYVYCLVSVYSINLYIAYWCRSISQYNTGLVWKTKLLSLSFLSWYLNVSQITPLILLWTWNNHPIPSFYACSLHFHPTWNYTSHLHQIRWTQLSKLGIIVYSYSQKLWAHGYCRWNWAMSLRVPY